MKRKRVLSISETYELFDICREIVDGFIPCFVFSRVLHEDLVTLFLKEWPGSTSKKKNSILPKKNFATALKIFLLDKNDKIVQFLASREWMADFLCSLFVPEGWASEIKDRKSVPFGLWTSVARMDSVQELFPNVSDSPHPAEKSVCVGRILYWRNMKTRGDEKILEEEESETPEPESGSEREGERLHLIREDEEEDEERSPPDCYTMR